MLDVQDRARSFRGLHAQMALKAYRFLAHPLIRVVAVFATLFGFGCVTIAPAKIKPDVTSATLETIDVDRYTIVLAGDITNHEGRHRSRCGAVLIGENLAATAWHCIIGGRNECRDEPGDEIRDCNDDDTMPNQVIRYYHRRDYMAETKSIVTRLARIVDADPASDLALIETDDHWSEWATLGTSLPGERVMGVGHPSGKIYTHQHTRVVKHAPMNRSGWRRATSRYVIEDVVGFGMSGGGLWNSQGQLIGICLSRNDKLKRSYYAGIEQVQKLLTP